MLIGGVLKFLGLVDGTNSDVYTQDMGNVEKCDTFLAITDYPSTGLGIELLRAAELCTLTLITAQVAHKVTRMVLGAAVMEPMFSFERYEDLRADLPSIVNENFAAILGEAR